jgi:hypothetical protein
MGQCCSDSNDASSKGKRYGTDAKDNATNGAAAGKAANGAPTKPAKKAGRHDDEDDLMVDGEDGRTHSAPTSPVTGHKQRVAPNSTPDPPRAKTRAQGIAGTTPAGGKAKHGHGRGAAPVEKRRRVMQRNLSHVSLSSPRKAENSTSSRSGTGDKSFLRPSASNTLGSQFKPSSRAPQWSEHEALQLRALAIERGDKEATMLRLAFQSNGSSSNDGGSPPAGMLSPGGLPGGGGGGGGSIVHVSMSLQDFQSWLLDSDEHPRDHYDAPSPLSSPLAAGLHGMTSVGGSVVPALTLPEALMQCFYIQQLFIDAQVGVGSGGEQQNARFGFSDFLRLLSLALYTNEQLLLFAFRALDTDEDGVIDNDDVSFLARALASIRIPAEWGIGPDVATPAVINGHNHNHHAPGTGTNGGGASVITMTTTTTNNQTTVMSTPTITSNNINGVAEVTETDVSPERGSPPTAAMESKASSPNPGSPTTSPRQFIHLPAEAKASQPVSDLMGPLLNIVMEFVQNRRDREQRYGGYAASIADATGSEFGGNSVTNTPLTNGNTRSSANDVKVAISLSDFSQLCKQHDWLLAPVRRLQQVIRHKTLSEEAWIRLMAVRDRSKLDSPSSIIPVTPGMMPPPLTMGPSAHQHHLDTGMSTVTVTGLTISTGASKEWGPPLLPPYVTPPGTSAPRITPGLSTAAMMGSSSDMMIPPPTATTTPSGIAHHIVMAPPSAASAALLAAEMAAADKATMAALPGTLNGSSHDE